MQEESKSLVDNAIDFENSLKELRNFSSQLYHAADYCETAFLNAKNKKKMVENTKEYVSQAVVTFVDHLGSISATLEYCISESNSVPQTENKIETLKLRIMTWQEYPHKLALHRFYCTSTFSRYHCRYISPPLTNSATTNPGVSRVVEVGVNAKKEKENKFETEAPKAELSSFRFQGNQKSKRSNINWKLMQNKEITSLIRRGKRILT